MDITNCKELSFNPVGKSGPIFINIYQSLETSSEVIIFQSPRNNVVVSFKNSVDYQVTKLKSYECKHQRTTNCRYLGT